MISNWVSVTTPREVLLPRRHTTDGRIHSYATGLYIIIQMQATTTYSGANIPSVTR
jgi:hypothetical protein